MNSPFKNRVLVIEQDVLLRESYAYVINGGSKYVVVGSCETVQDAFLTVRATRPDILLLDPDQTQIEPVRKLKQLYPHLRVLVWTSNTNSETVFELFKAGANGYLLKDGTYSSLLLSLDEIVRGGAPLSTMISRMIVNSFHVNTNTPLTLRETEILNLLATGRTYKEISDKLFIAKETSRKHISNIYHKLKVNSKAEAISVATTNKFIVGVTRSS